jgi:cell division protein FtsQ
MRRWLITILLIITITGLWLGAQSWSAGLRLSSVTVRGIYYVTENELRIMAALPDTALLSTIDLEEVRQRVVRHPYVKNASVNREFPSSIKITVEERIPAAVLVSSRMALIDGEGVVLPVRDAETLRGLAVISGSFFIPQTGDTIKNPAVFEALTILRATKETERLLHELFSEVHINERGGLTLYATDGGVPVLIGNDITAEKLIAFREFWLQEVVPAGTGTIQLIDLRFDGQIVTRWRSGSGR